jgi:colanic acid biosynthesis glycosyl transferase WcaI
LKILLITLYYVPDRGPDPALMSALAEGWVEQGHEVTVVCAFPHYRRERLPDPYRRRLYEVERPRGAYRIIRAAVFVPRKGTLIRRFFNYLSFAVTGGIAAVFGGRHDGVVVYTPPPTNGLIGYIASRLWRAPMIYNVQDIYPDIGVKLGLFKSRLLIRLMQATENFWYAKSAAITVISEGAKRILAGKGVPGEKLNIVENHADVENIRPLPPDNPVRTEFGWQHRFVVLYAGNVGLTQGLEPVLDVAVRMQDHDDLLFAFVGGGAGWCALEARATGLGLRNMEFHDFIHPRSKLPQLLACSSVSLVALKPGLTSESVPSKMYSIMASGRPILASVPRESDAWAIVEQSEAGICVPAGDADALHAALERLYRDESLRKRLGARGREWVSSRCRPGAAARKYLEIFARL